MRQKNFMFLLPKKIKKICTKMKLEKSIVLELLRASKRQAFPNPNTMTPYLC